jgi:hypothetical protein
MVALDAETVNWEEVDCMLLMVSVAVPPLVTVTVAEAFLPKLTFPKLMLVGFTENDGVPEAAVVVTLRIEPLWVPALFWPAARK